jgi:alpha-mannosidase
MYAEVFATGEKILKEATKVLGLEQVKTTTVGEGFALNTLPWHRKEVVDISETQAAVACGSGPLLNLRHFKINEAEPAVTLREVSKDLYVLENSHLKVEVSRGVITSLYDKLADREVIPKGQKANQYVIFDDKPLYWQAWDVEVYHLDTRKPLHTVETKVLEQKPHRVSITTHTKISDKSHIDTVISLSAALSGQPSHVEVTSTVKWHETMKFLKVEFPVDIRNTEASYETQFGIVRRPTHYNTSWDMAKFEVCCHRFADLSEHGYGVSILNDSKYGFATAGNVMRLSLLRSPKAPDADADMGTHTIRWGIFPHQGSLSHLTVRKAFEFNNPLRLLVAPAPNTNSVFTTDSLSTPPVYLTANSSPALVLDTVKRGEDDADVSAGELPTRPGRTVVLRIYDSLGGRARGEVETKWKVRAVTKTNLLEDELEEVVFKDGRFKVDLKPFEVATYMLHLED